MSQPFWEQSLTISGLAVSQPSSHCRSGEGFLLLFDVAALHTSPDHTSWDRDRVKLEMLKDFTGKYREMALSKNEHPQNYW